MALSGSALSDQKKFAVAMNYGTFQGQSAMALSSYVRVTDQVVVSGGLGYGVGASQFGVRVGVQFSW